jgi:hypothetical protein
MRLKDVFGQRTSAGHAGRAGASSTRTGLDPRPTEWTAWSTAWGGVVIAAFVNGALHRGYATAVGEPTATQVSEVVLPLLVAPWVLHVESRHRLPSLKDAVVVGAGWAAATVAFEFVFGHYVNGDSWQTLRAAYDLTQGRLWTLDVLLIAAAPAAARAWRLHRSRGDRSRPSRHEWPPPAMAAGPRSLRDPGRSSQAPG